MLDISPIVMLIEAGIFFVTLILLNQWLFQPLLSFMDKREAKLQEELKAVSSNTDEAKQYEEEIASIIENAKAKASKIKKEAIEEAKKLGINADGPLPCDTSFITAFKNKNHDCIVGMYHDALQSGLKAFGFDRGVTVQGGLPVPITTPAHGTAFDIAGKNKANLEPTLNSFKIALTMAENKSKNE